MSDRPKPTIDECTEVIKSICKEINLSDAEIRHRARLLYLINRLDFFKDLPVLMEEINYWRIKNEIEK